MKKIILGAILLSASATFVSCKKDKKDNLENRVEACNKASEKAMERALAYATDVSKANCDAFKAACREAVEKCRTHVSQQQLAEWNEAIDESCDD